MASELEKSACDLPFALHRPLYEALGALRTSAALREVFGDGFVTLYCDLKELEYREFQKHITQWERSELMYCV